jgi:hypothetical protein
MGISDAVFTEAIRTAERLTRLEMMTEAAREVVNQRMAPLENDFRQRAGKNAEEERLARIKQLESEIAELKRPPTELQPAEDAPKGKAEAPTEGSAAPAGGNDS